MQRVAALVPRPRLHLIRFHKVLAPIAKLRALMAPAGPDEKADESEFAATESKRAYAAGAHELGTVVGAGVRDRSQTPALAVWQEGDLRRPGKSSAAHAALK